MKSLSRVYQDHQKKKKKMVSMRLPAPYSVAPLPATGGEDEQEVWTPGQGGDVRQDDDTSRVC